MLNVILDTTPVEVTKPSAIAAASQDSQGVAKVGVQNNNPFPEQPLAATTLPPVEQPRIDIPKNFDGEEILTVQKSTQVDMVKSAPDLLATKEPAPEKPEDKEKPYAPAPTVAKPVAETPPTTEKLVSAELAPGEEPKKIVFAEPAQAKPPAEKPENIPIEPKPVKIEEPKPVKIEEPEPVKIEEPKPVKVEEPKPVKIEKPEPVEIEKPVKIEVAAESLARPAEAGKSDVFRAAPTFKIPSLAELSIASVRKFAGDDDRKIKYGERRKTVGIREQDIHYAMYVESVCLKLQRIGTLNYPAAAARDNLTGTLNVLISIRADGSLEKFSVIQSAPYEVLNKGAERIVRMSAPFSPLPDYIRQDTDVLSIRINWSFLQTNQSFE